MENRKLKGLAPENSFLEAAWEVAKERVKNNPNLVIVPDIEMGFPEIMTIEQRDILVEFWESLKPKNISNIGGRLFFFGTGGAMDNSNLKDFWTDGTNP